MVVAGTSPPIYIDLGNSYQPQGVLLALLGVNVTWLMPSQLYAKRYNQTAVAAAISVVKTTVSRPNIFLSPQIQPNFVDSASDFGKPFNFLFWNHYFFTNHTIQMQLSSRKWII